MPALVLDDGTLLNEGAAVLQYLADMVPPPPRGSAPTGCCGLTPARAQKPAAKVAPEPKSTARYLVQNALNWTASELHACVPPPRAAAAPVPQPPHCKMRPAVCAACRVACPGA